AQPGPGRAGPARGRAGGARQEGTPAPAALGLEQDGVADLVDVRLADVGVALARRDSPADVCPCGARRFCRALRDRLALAVGAAQLGPDRPGPLGRGRLAP